MFSFLHTFTPNPILITIGPLQIYWYGLFMVLGIIASILTTFKIAALYGILKDTIVDCFFYLIITGIIGARLYHIFLELPYYLKNPLDTIKIWNGGLAVHGAFLAGALTMFFYARKHRLDFWLFSSLFAPGLALAQAIGRWGNYFNQELFGLPTKLPWGIPIEIGNRIPAFYNYEYFHPTFLYESLGSVLISMSLLTLHYKYVRHKKLPFYAVTLAYICFYSFLRFCLEFIKIDSTPVLFNLRWPQIMSILLIFASLFLIFHFRRTVKAHLK